MSYRSRGMTVTVEFVDRHLKPLTGINSSHPLIHGDARLSPEGRRRSLAEAAAGCRGARGCEGPGRKGPSVLVVSLLTAFIGSVRRQMSRPGRCSRMRSRSAKRQP
jgi:hypothetical protein